MKELKDWKPKATQKKGEGFEEEFEGREKWHFRCALPGGTRYRGEQEGIVEGRGGTAWLFWE